MSDGPLTWTLLALLASAFLYKRFLVFTRDVPEEYLNEQSIIDSTRKHNESAIHKSTKLDYSQGLRVGLAIRYDHYKLRNGNLYDIWELAMGHAKKDPTKAVFFDKTAARLSSLNAQAGQIRHALSEWGGEKTSEIRIHIDLLFVDPVVFAVIIACFTSQITVCIFDESEQKHASGGSLDLKHDDGDFLLCHGTKIVSNLTKLADTSTEHTVFENTYSFEKDRGIALRIAHRVNHRAAIWADFTQSNLVSAVASCIKHIPLPDQIAENDRLAVVKDFTSIEAIANMMVKVLVTFVTGAELVIASDLDTCVSRDPTVISANNDAIKHMFKPTQGVQALAYFHRLYSLSCHRFSKLGYGKPYKNLRLIMAHRSITSAESSPEWRHVIASLAVHIVEEIGHFNTVGPLIVTDYFDFRTFSKDLSAQTRTYGAVAQSNEIKLVDFDGTSGKLAVRGYNMGKARTIMENVGESLVVPDDEGFYRLPVTARWGSDGCIYVMKE